MRVDDPISSKLSGHSSIINSVCFSPDGKQLASGSSDGTVRIWDPSTGQCAHIWNGPRRAIFGFVKSVYSVCFSPDSKLVSIGGWDNVVHVRDVKTGEIVCVLNGHSGSINSLCFSPDGKQLASGSDDQTVKIWDLSDVPQDDKKNEPKKVE